MAAVGTACLYVALLTALYAVGAAVYGAVTGKRRFAVSARRAFYSLAGLLVLAMAILEAAYVRTDLSFALVAQNSSTATPTFYKLTAMWSSQAGSLLLWVFLLAIFASAVLFLTRRGHREIAPWATAVLGVVAVFFLSLMVFVEEARPFATLAAPPADGAGLNPLLRHPAMMFHPPMLYTGYVGFTIPFAFAVGALITRRSGADWIRSTRRFALVAWTFLGFGILLGALWSYAELGWGGYWAWDPVENAALMPWLTGTAFIHSIMVQEKRGMLRRWNVALIMATFVLALTGTFLVRSGILDSIHAFGDSTLGPFFLGFIGLAIVGSVGLLVWRWDELRSEARLDSLLSREAFFLLNNVVLVALAAVVFWGTFFPLISEAFGSERSFGPPAFNAITTPLALVLVLLAGVGPVVAWRRVTRGMLVRALRVPLAAAGLTLAALLVLAPVTGSLGRVAALAMFAIVAFTLAVVAQELWRGTRARRVMTGEAWPAALSSLIGRNRRRYGGYTVHAGIALLFLGVAASSAFVEQRDERLSPGETIAVDDYEITYREPTAEIFGDSGGTGAAITFGAVLEVTDGDESFTLNPLRNYYPVGPAAASGPLARFFEGQPTSEVDLRWGLGEDLWVAVQPDVDRIAARFAEADERFQTASTAAQVEALRQVPMIYRSDPPP
ncbi:MAG TPA: cytochrome c-type biogenesis CcmF C-terminal domain-containing protein, partial [Thermoleophilaceae bacterium]|nr:cytochrome c-type biogenesis CcmF C-terminal domain-containing protein [Thermoleophilaceae bacterium]